MGAPQITPFRPDPLYNSEYENQVAINNNLVALFNLMSNNQWFGTVIDPQGCGCTSKAVLNAIAQNIWSFFYYFSANGANSFTRVDNAIRSLADLRAVPTVGQVPPQIKVWADAANELSQTWVLLAGTTADDGVSVIRPTDYNAGAPLTWYKAGS